MAKSVHDERVPQQLELTAKRLRIRGDGSGIHLGMVVSFSLLAALPFVLGPFAGSGGLALAALLAMLLLIAFVVHRVTPPMMRRRRSRPFRSNTRSAKIPTSGCASLRGQAVDPPSATRTRNACRKAS